MSDPRLEYDERDRRYKGVPQIHSRSLPKFRWPSREEQVRHAIAWAARRLRRSW